MRTSKRRILSMVLALMLCFSVLPVTAFAGGGPEDGSDKVLEYWSQDSTPPQDTPQTDQQTGQPATGQQPQQGEPLSIGSEFFTRDLLYSKDTHKQFITVEGRDGNIFYIVIDYDAPVNEEEEQYTTYFLNKVDEADLSALVEQGEPAACICTDKCHAGAVNTASPVSSVNMTECAGKEPEPEKKEDPAETDTEPDPEPEKKGGVNGMLAVALAVALAGGGAVYILKFKKKKPDTKGSADLEDYDYGDEDEYEDGGAEDEGDE